MTTIIFPTREAPAGVMENDTAVNRRLREFRFWSFSEDQMESGAGLRIDTSSNDGFDPDGPGTHILVPCEQQYFCVPRRDRC